MIVKVSLDGYNVGDRLLEGVMFNYEINILDMDTVEILSCEVDPSAADYFEDLNKEKWLEAMIRYVEDDPRNAWEYLSDEDYEQLTEKFEKV